MKLKILSNLLILIFIIQFLIVPASAEEQIIFDFFYEGECGTCLENKEIIDQISSEEKYSDYVTFNYKDKANDADAAEEYETVYYPIFNEQHSFPLSFVVIKNQTNETLISEPTNLNYEYLTGILDTYLAGIESNSTPGFEILFLFAGIFIIFLLKKKHK